MVGRGAEHERSEVEREYNDGEDAADEDEEME